MLFSVLVLFQVLNVFNARKLRGEHNPFEGLLTGGLFTLPALCLIVALQVLPRRPYGVPHVLVQPP